MYKNETVFWSFYITVINDYCFTDLNGCKTKSQSKSSFFYVKGLVILFGQYIQQQYNQYEPYKQF